MARVIVLLAALAAAAAAAASGDRSAADVARAVYGECLSRYSVECVKPRALEWLARVADDDEIRITEDLRIVRTARAVPAGGREPAAAGADAALELLDAAEEFVATHALRVRVPAALRGEDAAAATLVPRALLRGLPEELSLPLADGEDADTAVAEETRSKKHKIIKKIRKHGFIKKVLVPFLLGLKFKASVLVPLALALIALKTWKALTLGLISLVLSGAMVIFKFTKPKVVNYEVIHYPQQHVEHHVDHHVEHAPGWDAAPHHHAGPYSARALASDMAYSGHL